MKPIHIFFVLVSIFVLIMFSGCKKNKQEKTDAIIEKLNLIQEYKMKYAYTLDLVTDETVDRSSVSEIEKKITETEISHRISSAFIDVFSDAEIQQIYRFTQTSAFDKFFNPDFLHYAISSYFSDIEQDISRLRESAEYTHEHNSGYVVQRENGFYEIEYSAHTNFDNEIVLQDLPSLPIQDISQAAKIFCDYNNRFEISIQFTKEGTEKLHTLTKRNVGKPIVLVLANIIVFQPIVSSPISSGLLRVGGDFSETEINTMLQLLLEKNH